MQWFARAAVAVLCALGHSAAAQDINGIEFKTEPLGNDVYLLASGAGGNVAACVAEDGVFLVDSDYAQLSEGLMDAVAGISDQPVRFVLNTHWHFDHVGGNQSFATSGARIVAHENVRKRMAAGQRITIIDTDVSPSPKAALPTVTFTDSITFHFGPEEITAFHIPDAHTDGDVIVRFRKANVVHTGDTVFNRGYPFVDLSSDGSIDGMVAALETIVRISDDETKIFPGHGPLSTRLEMIEYAGMLRDFRSAVAKEIAAEKRLEEILTAKPTAALDEKWGHVHFPSEVFTEIVYRSLGGE